MNKIKIENVMIVLNEEVNNQYSSSLYIDEVLIIKINGKMTAEAFFNFIFDGRLKRKLFSNQSQPKLKQL